MRRRSALLVLGAIAIAAVPGCRRRREDEGTTPGGSDQDLPPLRIRDDTPHLMLTWVDERGNAHIELSPKDVPPDGRVQVRVLVSNRDEGTHDRFYVADLTKPEPDGSYVCRTMPRREWEDFIAKRRDAYLGKVSPPPSGSANGPAAPSAPKGPSAASSLTVVIYGAKWCRPCHEAADYLRGKGIQVVMKDVEQDPLAQEEMQGKLDQAGQRSGSIPIIDVRGQILIGFSPSALDRAVARALGGTTL